ncbi:hypothetical protein CRG98_005900 [Punica granatum]|uniref:Midasin n=1 Tax=Punica granatum TaxID=22663 RepID=A0A2I0KYW2_PUNGR|nr:hypothetical protein CRG98_005900 [Punica granatum]
MAIDGSFSVEFALRRFLAHCPELVNHPQIDLLSKKGALLTEDDVVNAAPQIFLHPKYTVPLVGCFRPLARRIVDQVVSLLHLVPNLRSNTSGTANGNGNILTESEILCGNVIEQCVRNGMGLKLHEFACLAFCCALDLAPFLTGPILDYFKFAPPPFERVVSKDFDLSVKVDGHLLDVVRTSYCFLVVSPEMFSKLWDWSCFLDLANQLRDFLSSTEQRNGTADIRWCTAQILAIIFNLGNTSAALDIVPDEAFECLLRWEEFSRDISLEKATLYIESCEQINSDTNTDFNRDNLLGSLAVNSMAFSLSTDREESRSQKLAQRDEKAFSNPFVLTSSLRRSFEMVLLAVYQKWPVLLHGPPGVGKSALIHKLAQDSGNYVLYIHMDDQIDGKTLLGSYACTEKPGEFRWQPGSLTQAVQGGFWVVFEDIDKAPSDVHSILLPLLEGARFFMTGHGEKIKVADSFRLFGTISASRHNTSSGSSWPGNLWRKVMIRQASHEDLKCILKICFPSLEPLSEKLIETFKKVNDGVEHKLTGWNSTSGRFSLRDLLKWCKRIVGSGNCFLGSSLSVHECQRIYEEAVDVFAAFLSSAENRKAMRKEIASIWAVPVSVAEALYPDHKPVIQDLLSELRVGRVTLQKSRTALCNERKPFVEIRSSLHAIERTACSVKYNEPVLLVGETGTGKTTLIQNLASRLGQKLTVLNLSQQSDVADLLGGFKPMSPHFVCIPLYKEFVELFSKSFSAKVNANYTVCLQEHFSNKNWKDLLIGMWKAVKTVRDSMKARVVNPSKKRKKPFNGEAWDNFSMKLETASRQVGTSSGMVFSFVEGAFVCALRNGEWILLDEVNLAPAETLQRIGGVLEGEGSLCLAERGDVRFIRRHPNFRIFACMNPATDAGKRDLPHSIRSRFTELFIDDLLDDGDLSVFVSKFVEENQLKEDIVKRIVRFYRAAKKDSEEKLQDGANQKPQYSLRSLFRALEYTRKAKRSFTFEKALYDGFCMFFLTLLDRPSGKIMERMILSYLLGGKVPPHRPFDSYITINTNSSPDDFVEKYVRTKTVKEQITNLARAVFIQKYPVLLQGPTSSGKTSLVRYLAAVTGREFVRINNHEHTDLQEYLGSYVTDSTGNLVFHEGVLVRAVRNGFWIVLDELNLAPSDVLEALNRLLDDNRELFVPELQETVKAHPNFMLFATQNPPTVYAGRKMLSRAFRNRFVEIHVDEIPEEELTTILENRCKISESYAKKMVEVMKDLQLHRQNSNVFAGKHGYITPRDLFRWADRVRECANSRGNSISKNHRYEDLAKEGYYLLAERLREESEKSVVKEVLKRHFHLILNEDDLYRQEISQAETTVNPDNDFMSLRNVIWTKSMWRMYSLVKRCYELREPVLLVGETGGGKTTVCQWLSVVLKSKLHILNCHQYTETSDFVGGFFPVRERSRLILGFEDLLRQLVVSNAFINYPRATVISFDIGKASSTLDQLANIINEYRQDLISPSGVTLEDIDAFERMKSELAQLHEKWQTIFTWQDGPLVQAMKGGHLFLVDEISLADDSVLERLNSVLEPERTLSLPEKGGSVMEKITAHKGFFVLATMNPGGDYGKKELSPALRNRFTEIWVPSVTDLNDLRSIASQRISRPEFSCVVHPMTKFWEWFNNLHVGRTLTLRDLLSWISFVNVTGESLGVEYALLHGVFLVLLDGLSLGTGIQRSEAEELRRRCVQFLLEHLQVDGNSPEYLTLSKMEKYGWGNHGTAEVKSCSENMECDNVFGIDPFYVERGNIRFEAEEFELLAPTTRRNALRVLRAMQLRKPVLLEGSPGVGKTSLVVALGRFSGHEVIRINLSEQTDMMDLLGSDLPVESDDEGIKFAWSDGILLQALKEGCWVLLDELNLAPQSVLEGLNAILDHRAEVYIPELNQTFSCPPSFRVFACQNPSSQGGGRKGLPKSFLNRFTKVYVDELVEEDLLSICTSLFPSIPRSLLSKLILFNKQLFKETMTLHKFAHDGSPWEFNLRDVVRSCEIIKDAPEKSRVDCFLDLLYVQRMRTASDRKEVLRLFERIFGVKPFINPFPRVQISSCKLIVGNTAIKRNNSNISKVSTTGLKILPSIRLNLEAAANCVKRQWLCILVGQSSSGKTSLVRMLAQLTGNVLHELNLSSATDISELLGSFEQYNVFRDFRSVISKIEKYVNDYSRVLLKHSVEASISGQRNLISRWHSFLSRLDFGDSSRSTLGHPEDFSLLMDIVELLKQETERNTSPGYCSTEELDKIKARISKLQEVYKRSTFATKFEWVTGILVKAVESGEWIILKNANLCNPTVLDRINSLVEPSGSIIVNECGAVDGKPVIFRPHSNFRLFLTVNPSYGEISRAMRNRGVEIFMMPPFWLLDGRGVSIATELELKDAKRFLIESGIPNSYLVDSMAKAHIYARDKGSCLNVRITYFELARWVELFQQLLINGNRPLWSLRISWEHTYLSSLGELEGESIVVHAVDDYLSMEAFLGSDSSGEPLCLPGGWPFPLQLRDFVWNPDGASVKQNCMYLEYLGAKSTTCRVGASKLSRGQALNVSSGSYAYWMDVKMLHLVMFPTDSNSTILGHHGKDKVLDLALVDKMMLFAAEWTIEQATKSDLSLYLLWLSWFSSQLLPFSHVLSNFVSTLRKELSHPIWKYIIEYAGKLKSVGQTDTDLQRVPLLSPQQVDLVKSSSSSTSDLSSSHFQNAINCIGLLRRSYQQWDTEERSNKFQNFQPLLKSLRFLEREILEILPKSRSFDVLVKLCDHLVEDHIQFWDCVSSQNVDRLLFFWRCLLKDVEKLQALCPQAAATISILKESRNLIGITSWNLYSEKSLLWIHGGHPFLPPSAEVYYAQMKFLKLCDSIWPLKTNSSNYADLAASFGSDLRFLAVQGICIASHLSVKDTVHIVERLEEMYQMLLNRFQHERHELETSLGPNKVSRIKAVPTSCCNVSPQLFLTETGYDSWMGLFSINDCRSFFQDMKILQEISPVILLDQEELQHVLASVSHLLYSALSFSLNYSLRPPQMFSGHQKLLWTLDAWHSIDAVNMKVAAFALEMWFRWHSSMWSLAVSTEALRHDGQDFLLPDVLMRPLRMAMAQNQDPSIPIKDYSACCLRLRVASGNIWRSSLLETEVCSFLLSTARALLQQIVCAHRKSFTAEKFRAIKSMFVSSQGSRIKQDDIQILSSLILSSSHQGLRDIVQLLVEPVLRHLYIHSPAAEFSDYKMGLAWLRIGGMRYHLLLSTDDLDPAMKYYCKQTLLAQKKSLLELEIKVREECDYLAGWLSSRGLDERRLQALNHLDNESSKIRRKVVFRSNPMKFKKLRGELAEFYDRIVSVISLVVNVEGADKQVVIRQLCDWQKTSISFIHRLSEDYHEYVDIVQPVQVAIYEMKLGLSLVHSSILERNFMNKIGEESIDRVTATICSFMRFPRPTLSRIAVFSNSLDESYSCEIELDPKFSSSDVRLLEKLVSATTVAHPDEMKQESLLQLKASLHHNMLVQAAHSIYNEKLMSNSSFRFLEVMFNAFANLWMDMKIQAKEKEELASQLYRFRTRKVKIDTIVEVDISSLAESLRNESFTEWLELAAEEGTTEEINAAGESENLEEAWTLMQEPILNDMVKIHIQMFGSSNLVCLPGTCQISDEEILRSFSESYRLGTRMIEDLSSLKSAILDASLVPEHLLQLCLDHEFVSSHHQYKFYKDPNAPVMAKIVKFLTGIEERVIFLLNENEDHPGLQKVLDIVKMLLALPLNTPLAKGLSGLQFLLNRGFMVKESCPKLSLTEQLDPIEGLVISWQKMELEAMPLLLDELEEQYEINAANLWFPLYSVLCRQSADASSESTIQSLQEFIHMSNVGEFRKRLQLILAFHGQISTGLQLGIYSSASNKETLRILYNLFGLCVQFLPTVMEYMETNRKSTEKEIRELLKLCKWERLMSMENSKRIRQKLRKLIQKYSDALEQPVKLVLNQRAAQTGIDMQFLQAPRLLYVFPDQNLDPLKESSSSNRSVWYDNWVKKLSMLHSEVTPGGYTPISFFMAVEEAKNIMRKFSSKQTVGLYQEEWKDIMFTLEDVTQKVGDCDELWKNESKSLGKRRALSDLLKLLENCGLARHMSSLTEDQHISYWLLQSSHNPAHLLLKKIEAADISSRDESHGLPKEADSDWRAINEFHFKSLTAIQLLRHVSMRFHKDFTLEQVNRSGSFLHHLAVMQQEQLDALYSSASNLRCLQTWITSLEQSYMDSSSECIISRNKHTILECLWRQKQLFDELWSILHDGLLLVKKVEIIHLDNCKSVRADAQEILALFERFIPVVERSKETLDKSLLKHDGAITVLDQSFGTTVTSKIMEELALHNFQVLKELEKDLMSIRGQNLDKSSVSRKLMDCLDDILHRGKLVLEQFNCSLGGTAESNHTYSDSNSEQETKEAFRAVYEHVASMLQRIALLSDKQLTIDDSRGNIPSWKAVFDSYAAELRVGPLCDSVVKAVRSAEKLISSSNSKDGAFSFCIGSSLKTLTSALDLIFDFGNSLLKDFMALHRMMCITTHTLAKNLALLYSRGYGSSAEEQVEDSAQGMSQNAAGTGMSEGAGVNDVSDQITDEDQLLGDSSKTGEEKDAPGDVPNKSDRGIEMEQDFDADICSVSKDSGEDDNENEESDGEQIESAMGKTGDESEIVDEKLWDENEDNDDNNVPERRNEKYESGPSVENRDKNSLELRGKEEGEAMSDEPQNDGNEAEQNDLGGDQEDMGDAEDVDDMKMDKEDAYMDSTGVEPNELNRIPEERDYGEEEVEGTDAMDEGPQEEDMMEDDLEQDPSHDGEKVDETGTKQVSEASEQSMEGQESEPKELDSTFPKEDLMGAGTSSRSNDYVATSELGTGLKNDSGASSAVNGRQEMDWLKKENSENDLAPISDLPSGAHSEQQDIMVAGQSDLGKLTEDRPKSEPSVGETSTLQRSQPNPYRNVGDALEGWKERARVPLDLARDKFEAEGDEVEDGDAEEYGFVSELEKGTAQALGPANSEQIDSQLGDGKDGEEDPTATDADDPVDMEIQMQSFETKPKIHSASVEKQKFEEPMVIPDSQELPEEVTLEARDHHNSRKHFESIVHVEKPSSSDLLRLSKMKISTDEKLKALDDQILQISGDERANAASMWRRYEIRTTRLSQELAEQLRLVMEPTLASKLQGDYKTGKRINMKKVIPYIASHYRKDKIWLRRTRPNKRDYQVVVAVDDSSSVSRSGCGEVAVEALVTVCRALSQLEMGSLAVASFGTMGNMQLLHDFDQPFSAEAGIKMISNLTFKQDNLVLDAPVLDLLNHLNSMLDVNIAKARQPSGQNPLQQLVLIIADGNITERDSLKRRVRDFLRSKRMVAFLILDSSSEESILDRMEASVEKDGSVKFSRYMDSFPFPYYAVLRNIEALPRTLADLLRQWFELMQNSRD